MEAIKEKEVKIDPEDMKNLNHKEVIHNKCGKKHIDKSIFSTFNHRKHLCHYCNEYFYDQDNKRGIGI